MVQGTSSRAACEGASRTGFVGDHSGPLIQSSDLKRCSGCNALPCRVHFCAVTESTSQSAASPATAGALEETRYQLWEYTPWAGSRQNCYELCPNTYCHRRWTRIDHAKTVVTDGVMHQHRAAYRKRTDVQYLCWNVQPRAPGCCHAPGT